jgi:hypothetical protein
MNRKLACALSCAILLARVAHAQGPSPQAGADARTACAADVQKLCAGVPSGGGRILACLKQHKDEVSPGCKQAVMVAAPAGKGHTADAGAASPAPAAAPAPAPKDPHASAATPGGKDDRYTVMKPAQIMDLSSDKKNTVAYTLMIPTTWKLDGWVKAGVAEGGCFTDFFSMFAQARSADGALSMKILPQSSWQYVDDPAGQQTMRKRIELDAKYKMKPCPMRAPARAADLMRKDILPKIRKDRPIVSIDPFPELDQITRSRLAQLPSSGDHAGTIRTEAVRARLAYDDENGKPVEEWVTAAVVLRTFPAGARGSGYDWRLVNLMTFRAPKGQLDANDRLFQMITASVHPEREWKTYSDGAIMTLFRAKQEAVAKQDRIIAELQQHIADTIMGVVANQQAGAEHSAFVQDQLVRGVQTFRDPASGSTYELSNLHDHAWVNGSNEYIMSDDPNFNPNGNLNGSWSQLQPQR